MVSLSMKNTSLGSNSGGNRVIIKNPQNFASNNIADKSTGYSGRDSWPSWNPIKTSNSAGPTGIISGYNDDTHMMQEEEDIPIDQGDGLRVETSTFS
ncbi:hypothetical protein V6N11_012153 [Hibiscus sabdariffa]|uniref:Uncharacterized protein n=1 Tax=Hibiscus sabdariffa TaxID=183260 RepID=A0ABR2QA77_9ROSI